MALGLAKASPPLKPATSILLQGFLIKAQFGPTQRGSVCSNAKVAPLQKFLFWTLLLAILGRRFAEHTQRPLFDPLRYNRIMR